MAIGAKKQKQFTEILETLKEIEADLEKQLDTQSERSRSADFAGNFGNCQSDEAIERNAA